MTVDVQKRGLDLRGPAVSSMQVPPSTSNHRPRPLITVNSALSILVITTFHPTTIHQHHQSPVPLCRVHHHSRRLVQPPSCKPNQKMRPGQGTVNHRSWAQDSQQTRRLFLTPALILDTLPNVSSRSTGIYRNDASCPSPSLSLLHQTMFRRLPLGGHITQRSPP